jgi:hypothetical protein
MALHRVSFHNECMALCLADIQGFVIRVARLDVVKKLTDGARIVLIGSPICMGIPLATSYV